MAIITKGNFGTNNVQKKIQEIEDTEFNGADYFDDWDELYDLDELEDLNWLGD